MSAVVMFEPTGPIPRTVRPGRPVGTSHRQHRRPAPSRSNRAAAVYRRRRLAAVALGIGAVLAVGHAGAALGGTSLAAPDARPRVVDHVVEPGDTLWSIAGDLAPGEDRRPVVDALSDARDGAALVPGETVTWLVP